MFATLLMTFSCIAPKALNSLTFQSFDFERTWWRLFQKRVVCTKFEIYVLLIVLQLYYGVSKLYELISNLCWHCSISDEYQQQLCIKLKHVNWIIAFIRNTFRLFLFISLFNKQLCVNLPWPIQHVSKYHIFIVIVTVITRRLVHDIMKRKFNGMYSVQFVVNVVVPIVKIAF